MMARLPRGRPRAAIKLIDKWFQVDEATLDHINEFAARLQHLTPGMTINRSLALRMLVEEHKRLTADKTETK